MVFNPRDLMSGLAKGLSVIESFTKDRPRQSITEVAETTGLDRATARRCLLTLAEQGYADYDGKFFTLTPRVLRLGTACLAAMPLPQIVQPFLNRLSDNIGHSSSVSILDGAEIVYVARAAQQKVMSIALMPGSRLPAYCTSMGRVLLAALPPAQAEELLGQVPLPARSPRSLTDPQAIMTRIHEARTKGYAVIDQEIELGLRSIAVPVYNSRGKVVAALNIGLSALYGPEEIAPKYLGALQEVQAQLRPLLH